MSSEFHDMEESLKEYINEAQSDHYNARNANFYKYNNLRVYMDPSKNKTPHLIVRVGISEAMFDLDRCEKISGGLGPDERLIRRWFDRNISKFDLGLIWKTCSKPKTVSMKEDVDD